MLWLACVGAAGLLCFALRGALARAGAQALTLPGRLETAVGDYFVQNYAEKLNTLTQENRALHSRLATLAPLEAENAALRQSLGSLAAAPPPGNRPARPVAVRQNEFVLACPGAVPGMTVLDAAGRFAGVVERVKANGEATVAQAGVGKGAAACLAAEAAGYLQRQNGELLLAGLPRHSGVQAGTAVTTAGGAWVGTASAVPVADASGLNCTVTLQDHTALLPSDAIYYVLEAQTG